MTHDTSDPPAVLVNGRFFARPVTGVERVAFETLRVLARSDRLRLELVVPRDVSVPAEFSELPTHVVRRLSGHAWEQVSLPRVLDGRVLLSLCNTAPLATRRQVVFLHDAAVFRTPRAYRPLFRYWYRFMHIVLTRRASHIVTNSRFSQAELAECCRVRPTRVTVAPLGVEHATASEADPSVFDRTGAPRSGYVLAVSSLNPNKNFGRLLEAVELLRRGGVNVPLVIAGATNDRVFERAQLPGGASFVGHVTDAELAALYGSAACFVYPSLYEGFGLPPLEAMSHGCPVVASRIGAVAEACGDAPMYCDPMSPRSIADAIERVLVDDELVTAMRAKGYEQAARHRWATTASIIEAALLAVSKH